MSDTSITITQPASNTITIAAVGPQGPSGAVGALTLTGAVTSVGMATSLGSFTSAELLAALSTKTGTGSAVFSISPTLTEITVTGTATATAYKLNSGTSGYVMTSDGSGNLSLAAPTGASGTAFDFGTFASPLDYTLDMGAF